MASIYKSAEGRERIRKWCTQRIDAWGVGHVRSDIMTSAGRTSVLTAGPAPARGTPSVVLIPGTNMNAAVCLSMAAALSADRHTVVLDVPGQPGLSEERRPRRDRMAWYGNWLSEVLEAAVPGPAVVIGHSLGGAIALASDSPRIVGRVLVSSAGVTRVRVSRSVLAATVPWLVRPSVPRATGLLRCMMAPDRPVGEDLAAWMALVGTSCRSSLAPPPLPAALLKERRATPCMVMTGRHDVFLPPSALGPAAAQRLGVELRVVEEAGHLLLDEAPHTAAELIRDFCATR
ncbi:alpha/beta hydrolase [Streptomyces sp. NPDC050315]|uniref:alpha/beta fold hydrolase n=1 Tax=Streptomyces sp. NPDC050315 TaxID=3155039 RepID=UPI00342AE21D